MAQERVLWAFVITIVLIFVAGMVVVVPSLSKSAQREEDVHSLELNLQEGVGILREGMSGLTQQITELQAELKELREKMATAVVATGTRSTTHCAPYEQVKIEEITDYLRSPKWFADKSSNVEDRSYIDFIINHYVPSPTQRKVYIDLGGNSFKSSIIWMRDNYKLKFDDIYVFEGVPGLFVIPPASEIGEEFHKSIHFQEIWLDTKDVAGRLNFPKWMEDLHLKEEDFVVMKMDIEGMEWDMLPALEAKGLDKVIDELFVEIHYNHPDMNPYGWGNFPHNIEETKVLLRHWRSLGVYTHYWP